MKTYDLYVETGPQHKNTMVHVFDLFGCVATGRTMDEAIEGANAVIPAYLRLLKRCGENVDPKQPWKARIAQVLEVPGKYVGMDSSAVTFDPDLKPVTPRDIETWLGRYHGMSGLLVGWIASQSDKQLEVVPESGGRSARKVITHCYDGHGYLSPVIGEIRGIPTNLRIERGEVTLTEAIRRAEEIITERVRAATPEQRRAVIRWDSRVRTLRKSFRRLLEHYWEHLAELSRRPGGPKL